MEIIYKKEIFAPMLFLDVVLEEYKDGYPNPLTADYYETLRKIRESQNQGKIPEALYKRLGFGKKERFGDNSFETIEYGYFTANIHYYLYESCSEYEVSKNYKDAVNHRILYFLKNADIDALCAHGWFPLNFPNTYLSFLEKQYGKTRIRKQEQKKPISIYCSELLNDFALANGNAEEIDISNLVLLIISQCDEKLL